MEAPESGHAKRLLLAPDLLDFGNEAVAIESDRVLKIERRLVDLVLDFEPVENVTERGLSALRGYPVTFSWISRYLNGAGRFDGSGFKSLSMR
jgi:hypothetical protein